MLSRRAFVGSGLAATSALLLPGVRARVAAAAKEPLLKPPRLRTGDTIGLINPVGVPLSAADVDAVTRSLQGLGMRVTCAAHVRECVLGRPVDDRRRAEDVNGLFADRDVAAILPIRGGWGSARLLPHLDYELIRRHPKVLMGFSDADALLLGVHARARMVTFHGPMGISPWVPFTVESMRRVLFAGEAATLSNPRGAAADSAARWRTLVPGTARGRLLGGNLTVLSSIVGSPYLGADEDLVLFLEEVREPTSEVDRMLTHLELSGVLRRARGLVLGQFPECVPPALDGSLTLQQVFGDYAARLGIPAWQGALIGHVDRQLTVPIGLPVEVDASRGTIQLLEAAVV
jgi:muramoyltetrapeptide carboxypeptidase